MAWVREEGGYGGASQVALLVKSSLPVQETTERRVWSHALEEGMATHSSILAWRIPWTEEPGGLQSMGSQRVGHDRSDLACTGVEHRWTLCLPFFLPLFIEMWWGEIFLCYRKKQKSRRRKDKIQKQNKTLPTQLNIYGRMNFKATFTA